MRRLVVLICLSLVELCPAMTSQKFLDRITFAGYPRAGMECAAYLAASREHLPAEAGIRSPVDRENARQAIGALRWFADDVERLHPGLPPVVPNEETMSVLSTDATAEDVARVLGRLASAMHHGESPPGEDERVVGFRLRGVDAIRRFEDARLTDLGRSIYLARNRMVTDTWKLTPILYLTPLVVAAGALWKLVAGTPISPEHAWGLLALPLLIPVHGFVADRSFPKRLERYLAFAEGAVSGPTWHFESTTASLCEESVRARLDPDAQFPAEGETVDGARLFRAILAGPARHGSDLQAMQYEPTLVTYLFQRLLASFYERRRAVSVDRLLMYDNRGVEGPRWELTVLLRMGYRYPRPPVATRSAPEPRPWLGPEGALLDLSSVRVGR